MFVISDVCRVDQCVPLFHQSGALCCRLLVLCMQFAAPAKSIRPPAAKRSLCIRSNESVVSLHYCFVCLISYNTTVAREIPSKAINTGTPPPRVNNSEATDGCPVFTTNMFFFSRLCCNFCSLFNLPRLVHAARVENVFLTNRFFFFDCGALILPCTAIAALRKFSNLMLNRSCFVECK